MVWVSVENLERIRPEGVTRKNLKGARSTARSKRIWDILVAFMVPMYPHIVPQTMKTPI